MPLSNHALTTYAAVKEYLKLSTDDEQNSLERMINAVSEMIEKYCDRHFEKATYTEKYRGNNRQLLRLNQYPVLSVASVTIDGDAADDYEILSEEGMLYREDLWTWTGYSIGLVGEDAGSKRNIEVQYTAGYVLPKDDGNPDSRTLPYDLEDACIQLVAIRHEMRGSEHMKSERIGPLTSDFVEDIPSHIRRVLDKYRRLVIV